MKSFRWLLAIGAVAALLAGCGGGGDAETAEAPVKGLDDFQFLYTTLDSNPGPETAGLLTANNLGHLSDVGLGIKTSTPSDPMRPIEYMTDNSINVDIAVTHEPQVVLAQEEGVPIVAIASLVPQPTLSMIWLSDSGIEGIADLKGKTIGIPGASFQRDFLEAVLRRAGLKLSDVKIKESNYQLVPDLVKGRVDAIFGGSWNVEGVEIELRGFEPVVTKAEEMGIPPYDELVVVARKDRVAKDPKLSRSLAEGVARGTAAAIKDPESATEAIRQFYEIEFHPKPIEAGVEATLPLLAGAGPIDRQQVSNLIAWMHKEGMIERKLPVSALLAP